MGIFREYPYMNFSDYNLDWIINNEKRLAGAVEGLDEWKTNHEAEYRLLKNEVDDLALGQLTMRGRKFLFIGDSYAYTHVNTWVEYCAQALGLTADQYENLAVSGTGFNVYGLNSFMGQIVSYAGERDKITDIVVCGGINDALNRTTATMNDVINGIAEFAEYAKRNYVHANLWLGYIGGCKYTSQYYASHTIAQQKMAKYCYVLRSAESGWTYLTGVENAIHLRADYYGDDGLHPSNAGSMEIGRAVANAIKKAYRPEYPEYTMNARAYSGVTIPTLAGMYSVDGDECTININKFLASLPTGTDINAQTDVPLVTFGNFVYNGRMAIPCELLFLNFGNQNFYGLSSQIILEGNTLLIQTNEINSAGSGYINLTHSARTGQISLYAPLTITVPTSMIN